MDVNPIALLLMLIVGVVLLIAQLRLFSIDKTLKEIRSQLASSSNSNAKALANPLSIK